MGAVAAAVGVDQLFAAIAGGEAALAARLGKLEVASGNSVEAEEDVVRR
jgi:hypothetical protein